MGGISNLYDAATNIGGSRNLPVKAPGSKAAGFPNKVTTPLPRVLLELGDYTFTRMEIPEKINLGGEQKLVIHELVGGNRVIDAMGRQYDPLTWSGWFLGETAIDSAKYLDFLRKQGKPLVLKWSEFEYSVIIKKFTYDFVQQYKLQYSITCEVVTDSSVQVTTGFDVDVDQALKDDMGSVAAAVALIATPSTPPVSLSTIDKLKQAFKDTKSFVRATQKTIHEAKALIQDAQREVTQVIAEVSNTIQDVSTLGGVLPNNPVSVNATRLSQVTKNTNNSVQLLNIQSSLGKMNKNMATIKGV